MEMYFWLAGIVLAAISGYALYFFWKVRGHPAQVLLRESANMGWVQTGIVNRDGDPVAWAKRSVRLARGSEEAVIWYKDATITLVRVHAPPTFNDFLELERWIGDNPNDEDNEETNAEIVYLREIEKYVTRMGYFDSLLEAHATDELFFLACTKFYKAGYLTDQPAQVVAALTLAKKSNVITPLFDQIDPKIAAAMRAQLG